MMQTQIFSAAAVLALASLLPTSLAQFNLNVVHWGDLHGRCGAVHVMSAPGVLRGCQIVHYSAFNKHICHFCMF